MDKKYRMVYNCLDCGRDYHVFYDSMNEYNPCGSCDCGGHSHCKEIYTRNGEEWDLVASIVR